MNVKDLQIGDIVELADGREARVIEVKDGDRYLDTRAITRGDNCMVTLDFTCGQLLRRPTPSVVQNSMTVQELRDLLDGFPAESVVKLVHSETVDTCGQGCCNYEEDHETYSIRLEAGGWADQVIIRAE